MTALLRLADCREPSGQGGHQGGSPMRSIEEAPQSWWSPALLSLATPEKEMFDWDCVAVKQRIGSVLVLNIESADAALLHAGCIALTNPADDP